VKKIMRHAGRIAMLLALATTTPVLALPRFSGVYGVQDPDVILLDCALPLAGERPGEPRSTAGFLTLGAGFAVGDPARDILLRYGLGVEHWLDHRWMIAISAHGYSVAARRASRPYLGDVSSGMGADLDLYGLARLGARTFAVAGMRQAFDGDLWPLAYGGLCFSLGPGPAGS